jgi:hypothetical protein
MIVCEHGKSDTLRLILILILILEGTFLLLTLTLNHNGMQVRLHEVKG